MAAVNPTHRTKAALAVLAVAIIGCSPASEGGTGGANHEESPNQDSSRNQEPLFDLPAPDDVVETIARADYIDLATKICGVANANFQTAVRPYALGGDWSLEDHWAWHLAAARFSEEALAELRAVPRPAGDTWINRMFSHVEQETAVLSELAAAASAEDWALVEKLERDRVTLTHHRIHPGCPIQLPA